MTNSTPNPVPQIVASVLGLLMLTLGGCVYQLGSSLPPNLKTVYVPTFVNKCGEPQVENETTQATIQEFQKAKGNPHRRIAAMNFLAQCFTKRKMFDLATRTLQEALKEKLIFDEEKKELIYLLGCVYEKMAKREEAIAQFKLIYAVDAGYKDIQAKIDAYYGGQT